MKKLAPILIAATLSACAHKTTCLKEGAAPWVEASSEHFVLRTDLDAEEAKELVQDFEQIHAAFLDLAFRSADPPREPLHVYLFSRKDELRDIRLGEHRVGVFFHDDVLFHPTVLMEGDFDRSTRVAFQHELTHHFVRHFIPHAPRWLNEGTAMFWQTLAIENGKVTIGKPLGCGLEIGQGGNEFECRPGDFVRTHELPSIEELVNAPPQTFYSLRRVKGYYFGAWALVHILMMGSEIPQDRVLQFQRALAEGAPPKQAWADLLKGADASSLADRYRGYFVSASIPHVIYEYRPAEKRQVTVRPMRDEEMHLMRARWLGWSDDKVRARSIAELDKALQHAPDYADAHYVRGVLTEENDAAAAVQHYDRAIELSPDDPRYLLARLLTLTESDVAPVQNAEQELQAEAVLDKLKRRAKGAHLLNMVAWYYAQRGRPMQGMPFALRSLDAEPGCWECLDTLALLKHQQGKTSEALELQTRAINLIPDFQEPPKQVLERLETYSQTKTSTSAR